MIYPEVGHQVICWASRKFFVQLYHAWLPGTFNFAPKKTPLFSLPQVAYGVFLKCAAVVVIFISMNTVGLILFQGDPPARTPAMFALHNASDVEATTM